MQRLLDAVGFKVTHKEAMKACAAVSAQNGAASKPAALESVMAGLDRVYAVREQPGRHLVLLSLAEAEALRIMLHLRAPWRSLLPGKASCHAALRLLRVDPPGLSVLDASPGWQEAPFQWQEDAISQCLLFLSSNMRYSTRALATLRQSLQASASPTPPEILRDFFLTSHASRRRVQPPQWQEEPVARLFDPENQYQQMKREEVLRKSRLIMLDSGSSPKAGWAILDKDNAGQIGLNELSTMASQALGVPYLLLVRLVEVLDAKGTGTISKDDWLSALGDKETVTSTNLAGERPNKLRALFNPAAHPLPNAGVPLNILPYISLKVVAHTAFTGVWNSQGSDCRAHASIWAPDQLRDGVFRMKALRVSVGHYANQGFLDARGGDRYGVSKRQILQVKDISMVGLPDEHLIDFANYYLPNPAMFREVWNQLSGQQHLTFGGLYLQMTISLL